MPEQTLVSYEDLTDEEKQQLRGLLPEEFQDRLLLAETTDEEINQAVLQPMFRSGPLFWGAVAILLLVVIWGLYAWGYQIRWGFGILHRHIYLLGRHQPCRHHDFGRAARFPG